MPTEKLTEWARRHLPATHLWDEMPIGGICSVKARNVHGRDKADPKVYSERVDVVKIAPGSQYYPVVLPPHYRPDVKAMVNAIVIDTGELAYVSGGLGVIMKRCVIRENV